VAVQTVKEVSYMYSKLKRENFICNKKWQVYNKQWETHLWHKN